MTGSIDVRDVERLRRIVSRRFGFRLGPSENGALEGWLKRRLAAERRPCGAFLSHLENGPATRDLRAIAVELTVPETYFFRNTEQFQALRDVVLPERTRARGTEKKLRVLSAGCASGEEPYTLAIVLREAALDPSWDVSILAVDVNVDVLARAAQGRFSSWAFRETPPDVQRRWFHRDGDRWVLDDTIRRSVQFAELNLTDAAPWPAESFDVIFWRNVMMYFTPECARRAAANLIRALAPGGFLFLGPAETLRGHAEGVLLRRSHGAFYYQRDGATKGAEPSPAEEGSWVEAIGRATRRIEAMASTPPPPPAASPTPPPAPPSEPSPLARALDLFRDERVPDALAALDALPHDAARAPEALLLRAALLTHGNQLARAEEACRELLASDTRHVGAHYLLALCRQGSGDQGAARDHFQRATALDPSFGMPHLHLGLMARRESDDAGARRELTRALALLQREESSRILLFGGGFGRSALLDLCRAELSACGGSA